MVDRPIRSKANTIVVSNIGSPFMRERLTSIRCQVRSFLTQEDRIVLSHLSTVVQHEVPGWRDMLVEESLPHAATISSTNVQSGPFYQVILCKIREFLVDEDVITYSKLSVEFWKEFRHEVMAWRGVLFNEILPIFSTRESLTVATHVDDLLELCAGSPDVVRSTLLCPWLTTNLSVHVLARICTFSVEHFRVFCESPLCTTNDRLRHPRPLPSIRAANIYGVADQLMFLMLRRNTPVVRTILKSRIQMNTCVVKNLSLAGPFHAECILMNDVLSKNLIVDDLTKVACKLPLVMAYVVITTKVQDLPRESMVRIFRHIRRERCGATWLLRDIAKWISGMKLNFLEHAAKVDVIMTPKHRLHTLSFPLVTYKAQEYARRLILARFEMNMVRFRSPKTLSPQYFPSLLIRQLCALPNLIDVFFTAYNCPDILEEVETEFEGIYLHTFKHAYLEEAERTLVEAEEGIEGLWTL